MALRQHQGVLRQHQGVLPAAAGSTRHGDTKVTDDLKHGKVITEKFIPIEKEVTAKQVTKDYQNDKVTTTELMVKKTTTKDYRKGTVTVTTKDHTKAKSVTEDNRKGIKTTEKLVTTKTSTKDCTNTGRVVTKQSHHSSKEIHPMSMPLLENKQDTSGREFILKIKVADDSEINDTL